MTTMELQAWATEDYAVFLRTVQPAVVIISYIMLDLLTNGVALPHTAALSVQRIETICAGTVWRDLFDWISWAANPLLAVVGIGGIFVALRTLGKISSQARAATEGVKVAQATLVSTFRPKLIVRSLMIHRDKEAKGDGKRSTIAYDLVNVGGTNAYVTRREVCVHYNRGKFGGGNFGESAPTDICGEGLCLRSGECSEIHIELAKEVEQTLDYLETQLARGVNNPLLVGQMFVTGRIDYRDDLNATRQMAFHRSYNQATKRFSTVADPDYEYSD